jgi:signal transduction histidine kinase
MPPIVLSTISLHYDYDLVAARRRARQVAAHLQFDDQDQTRIATVASEIARNALRYGGGGVIEFGVDRDEDGLSMTMAITDRGPGIANLDEILAGRYQSQTGMGMGLLGARRLMDAFTVNTAAGRGTTVLLRKRMPGNAIPISNDRVKAIADALARQRPENPIEEIQQQNVELMQALASLTERKEELLRLNQELEDTNRGVLALYAELDEKAESLRHADQLKSRFLSDMSHEFRTPVNSIMALTRLLEESELGAESRKQVSLIQRSAEGLSTLVEDLLDLAKIEAGKIEVRPTEFEVMNLFSALRGMLRPIQVNRSLVLVFEDPENIPPMYGDEGKIAQILRNFISNALKFTESGEVRVRATLSSDRTSVVFSVADTGIGIAPQDLERVFEEFTQLEHPLQQRHKGTGLGLPLTRKLAELMGGRVWVESEPHLGSTFFAELPLRYAGTRAAHSAQALLPLDLGATIRERHFLIVDDDETARYTMREFASRPGATISEAVNGLDGIAMAKAELPDLIFLDLMMPGIGGHEVMQRLKSDPATSSIPVIVVSSRFINEDERRQILTRAFAVINKAQVSREVVSRAIDEALASEA